MVVAEVSAVNIIQFYLAKTLDLLLTSVKDVYPKYKNKLENLMQQASAVLQYQPSVYLFILFQPV